LVLLLSIALVSGNAHAALHLDNAHHEPCPEEHARSLSIAMITGWPAVAIASAAALPPILLQRSASRPPICRGGSITTAWPHPYPVARSSPIPILPDPAR
jgi:hypothetical protein